MTDFEQRIQAALDVGLSELSGLTSSPFLLEAVYKMALTDFAEGLARRCAVNHVDAAEFLRTLAGKVEAKGENDELDEVIYLDLKPAREA